ncbi:MAG: HU family DNA-binding protein [Melioribacteraceae bacterium]|nr:HU family DNA-binding protein [Melioribacteraceae bacterium]
MAKASPATKASAMTKAALVDHFAKKLSITKKLANDFLVEYAAVSYKEAKKGFTFPGVGKLVVVARKKRKGINPSTGERIIIPAKKVVKFKVSKTCQDAVYPPKK